MSPAGTGFGLTVVGISVGVTAWEIVVSAGCVVPVVPTGFVWASTDFGSFAGRPPTKLATCCWVGGIKPSWTGEVEPEMPFRWQTYKLNPPTAGPFTKKLPVKKTAVLRL
jgi:hypothetical protein